MKGRSVGRVDLFKILFGNHGLFARYDTSDRRHPLCSLPSFAAERRKQERRRQYALLNGTAKPQNLPPGWHLLRCRRSPVTKTGFTPPPCICNPRAILRCFAVAAQPLQFRFASAVSLRRPHDLGAARPQDPLRGGRSRFFLKMNTVHFLNGKTAFSISETLRRWGREKNSRQEP